MAYEDMLVFNERYLLNKVKGDLGFPYNIIEFTDDKIVEEVICSYSTRLTFSKRFPYEERIYVSEKDNENKDNMYSNRYTINSKNIILNITKLYPIYFSSLVQLLPTQTGGDPLNDAIDGLLYDINKYEMNFNFIHPNIIEVYGGGYGQFLLVAETIHSADLSTIPVNKQDIYITLVKGVLSEKLKTIRSKYGSLTTPFGELSLNIDLLDAAIQKKDDLFDKIDNNAGNLVKRGIGIVVA